MNPPLDCCAGSSRQSSAAAPWSSLQPLRDYTRPHPLPNSQANPGTTHRPGAHFSCSRSYSSSLRRVSCWSCCRRRSREVSFREASSASRLAARTSSRLVRASASCCTARLQVQGQPGQGPSMGMPAKFPSLHLPPSSSIPGSAHAHTHPPESLPPIHACLILKTGHLPLLGSQAVSQPGSVLVGDHQLVTDLLNLCTMGLDRA